MMTMMKQVLVLLMLILSIVSRITTGFYTYNDNYSEENYEYNEEVEVEEEANFLPVFESSPTVYRVRRGNTARLECKVDNLGPMILSWKRLRNNTSEYIVTGSIVIVRDKRVSVLTSTTSSMLVITLMSEVDTGEYVCEVSSTPPVHIKHWLKMKAQPTVHILGKPTSGQLTIQAGSELGLVCRGEGEPGPEISWRREGQSLPDGKELLAADQMIFSSIGRDHAGTYTCTGDNGEDKVATDSVVVQVTYTPVISVDHNYLHKSHNISLEMICNVQAFPKASVEWSRVEKDQMIPMDKARLELRGEGMHVLILDNPEKTDMGHYQCKANNTMGVTYKDINILKDTQITMDRTSFGRVSTHDDNTSDTSAVVIDEKSDHRLLKHMMHKMKKFDKFNTDMVRAIKQSNRYLYQILRNQKILLARNSTNKIL